MSLPLPTFLELRANYSVGCHEVAFYHWLRSIGKLHSKWTCARHEQGIQRLGTVQNQFLIQVLRWHMKQSAYKTIFVQHKLAIEGRKSTVIKYLQLNFAPQQSGKYDCCTSKMLNKSSRKMRIEIKKGENLMGKILSTSIYTVILKSTLNHNYGAIGQNL